MRLHYDNVRVQEQNPYQFGDSFWI